MLKCDGCGEKDESVRMETVKVLSTRKFPGKYLCRSCLFKFQDDLTAFVEGWKPKPAPDGEKTGGDK